MIIEIDRDSMMQFPILTEEETGKLFRALGFKGGDIHTKNDFKTGSTFIWEETSGEREMREFAESQVSVRMARKLAEEKTINEAHEAALRILGKTNCICPWHDEAVATYPNTSHQHAEVMLRVHQDERIPIVYNNKQGEFVLRPFTLAEEQYIDGGAYPPGWEKR